MKRQSHRKARVFAQLHAEFAQDKLFWARGQGTRRSANPARNRAAQGLQEEHGAWLASQSVIDGGPPLKVVQIRPITQVVAKYRPEPAKAAGRYSASPAGIFPPTLNQD